MQSAVFSQAPVVHYYFQHHRSCSCSVCDEHQTHAVCSSQSSACALVFPPDQTRQLHWDCGASKTHVVAAGLTRGRYHGGRPPSSDDSLHSPTVIPPSALDKPSIMNRYHRRQTCSHTSPRRSPTTAALHDTRFVECRWWNDGWTVKTVVT